MYTAKRSWSHNEISHLSDFLSVSWLSFESSSSASSSASIGFETGWLMEKSEPKISRDTISTHYTIRFANYPADLQIPKYTTIQHRHYTHQNQSSKISNGRPQPLLGFTTRWGGWEVAAASNLSNKSCGSGVTVNNDNRSKVSVWSFKFNIHWKTCHGNSLRRGRESRSSAGQQSAIYIMSMFACDGKSSKSYSALDMPWNNSLGWGNTKFLRNQLYLGWHSSERQRSLKIGAETDFR